MFARSVLRPLLHSQWRTASAMTNKTQYPLSATPFFRTSLRSVSSDSSDDDDSSSKTRFTTRFHLHSPKELKVIPTFRLMDNSGKVLNKSLDPGFSQEQLQKMYRTMFTLSTMDFILYEGQRQGRLSFYMTSYGEEASHIGSAAALEQSDLIYGQYRETGVMLWRGFTPEDCMNQCLSNELDLGKGRQMPVHYGSKDINFHTISSPLGTQLPQASGAAYAFKIKGQKNVVVCYFGEGAASEGDFHPALNFSSTLDCPVLFICRNNGYAISTPAHEQYRGDGIASRAIGYGMEYIRVDGNDVFAMYVATKNARDYAIQHSRPVLIEAMTYRIGHHSTSDDSSRYRTTSEIDHWKSTNNPLKRLRLYMEERGWWSEAQEAQIQKETRERIQSSLKKAELLKKPSLKDMFTDVYDTLPPNLQEQQQQLLEHLKLFPDHYDIQSHKQ